MSDNKKSVNMVGIVLVAVSSVLVVDTVAASAIIGPSAIGWWVAIFFIFFLPYGFVTAELGTAYPDEGGIVDWVTRAFGKKVAARVSWISWVNYSLWIPAAFYMFAVILGQMIDVKFSPVQIALISITISWIASWLATYDLDKLTWIASIGAVFKMAIMISLGCTGLYLGVVNGFANPFTFADTLPSFGDGATYLPVIIFNLMGFEIIAGAASSFKDPNKDIPRATIMGGILMMALYILASLGMLAVIPINAISDSTGVLDAYAMIFGTTSGAKLVIGVAGVMVLYTLVSNIITWAIGVNQTVVYAAKKGMMPKSFAKCSEKTGSPTTASWANGCIATATMVFYIIMVSLTGSEDLFWNVFSLGAIGLLASYVMLFPAYLVLHIKDKATPRPYAAPGGELFRWYAGIVPTLILLAGLVFFFWAPGVGMDMEYFWTVGSGLTVAMLLGEFFIWRAKHEAAEDSAEDIAELFGNPAE